MDGIRARAEHRNVHQANYVAGHRSRKQEQEEAEPMPKKKATAVPAVAAVAAPPAAGASAVESAVAITPAEAKKLAKLLKASDRGKRLDAIRVVSENHGYLSTGGCLLPLVESLVAKKKTEEVVKAAGQVYSTTRFEQLLVSRSALRSAHA